MLRTIRFRQVQVKITGSATAGNEFSFGNQEDLAEAIIDGIETFNAADVPNTETGQPLVTAADSIKLVLYVNEDSNDKERAIPYEPQRATINSGIIRQYRNLVITWPKTRVRVVSNFAATTDTYAMVGVHYHYPKDVI